MPNPAIPDDIDPPITPKGERTQARIFDAALSCFASRGFKKSTMRDIATAADCSLGLLYRYYPNKDAFAATYYRQFVLSVCEEMDDLPMGTIAMRYRTVLENSLGKVMLQRTTLAAVFIGTLSIVEDEFIVTPEYINSRLYIADRFKFMVRESTDCPKEKVANNLGSLLMIGHTLVLLFWLYDRTPQQIATDKLIDFVDATLRALRPLMMMPMVDKGISRLANILMALFANQVDLLTEES